MRRQIINYQNKIGGHVKSWGDKSRAAIASALAAELNDMEILRPHVAEAMRRLRDECLEVIVPGNYKSAPLSL